MQKKWLIARYNDLGYYAGKGALLKVILDGFETEGDALKQLETEKDWPVGNYVVLPYYAMRDENVPS